METEIDSIIEKTLYDNPAIFAMAAAGAPDSLNELFKRASQDSTLTPPQLLQLGRRLFLLVHLPVVESVYRQDLNVTLSAQGRFSLINVLEGIIRTGSALAIRADGAAGAT